MLIWGPYIENCSTLRSVTSPRNSWEILPSRGNDWLIWGVKVQPPHHKSEQFCDPSILEIHPFSRSTWDPAIASLLVLSQGCFPHFPTDCFLVNHLNNTCHSGFVFRKPNLREHIFTKIIFLLRIYIQELFCHFKVLFTLSIPVNPQIQQWIWKQC